MRFPLSSAFSDSTDTISFLSVKTLLSKIPLGFDFNSKSCGILNSIFNIVCAVFQSSSLELELPAQALVSASSKTSGLLVTIYIISRRDMVSVCFIFEALVQNFE